MFQKVTNKSGFSLVELMVVVAIIGILASLAIPQVTKFQAKARQSEAKSMLSTIYSSEKAFFAEYSAYHSAFAAIGFSPEGSLRYNVGFTAGPGNAGVAQGYNASPSALSQTKLYCGAGGTFSAGCTILLGTNNAAPTTLADSTVFGTYTSPAAGTAWSTSAAAPGSCEVHTIPATGATFLACATAAIYQGNVDFWSMDHQKKILNLSNGIP